jgi:hypothetical protein
MTLQPRDARENTQLCGGGGFSGDFPTRDACQPRIGLGRGRDLVVPHFLGSSGLVQLAAVPSFNRHRRITSMPRQFRASPWQRWRCCGKLNQSPTHPSTDPLANEYHHHQPRTPCQAPLPPPTLQTPDLKSISADTSHNAELESYTSNE